MTLHNSGYDYTIYLEDLWFNKDYMNPTYDAMTGKINYHEAKKDERISIISPFIFRYLLFCDQCHDFCENAERNGWKSDRQNVLNFLIQSYVNDIDWLLRQLFGKNPASIKEVPILLELLPEINISIGEETKWIEKSEQYPTILSHDIYLNTTKMTIYINYILGKYLDIIPFNSIDFNKSYGKHPCSDSSQIIDLLVRLVPGPLTKNNNQWNLCVDADKSKINLGSLLLFFCDKVSSDPDTNINLYNTNGTLYDAASGSGTFSYLNKINDSLDNITDDDMFGHVDQMGDTNYDTSVEIKYKSESLLKFKYVNKQYGESDPKLDFLYKMLTEIQNTPSKIYDIKSGKPSEQNNITLENISKLKSIIYGLAKSIPTKIDVNLGIGIGVDFTRSVSWSTIKKEALKEFNEIYKSNMLSSVQVLFLYLYNIILLLISEGQTTAEDLKKKIEENKLNKNLLHLAIEQFFGKTVDKFSTFNTELNHENASVPYITSKPITQDNVSYITCFKTLGDFGQIASFYGLTQNQNKIYERNIFLTFDQICSQISSLFLRFAIFENLDKEVSRTPLTIYIKKGSIELLQQATTGLLQVHNQSESMDTENLFGKYKRKKNKLIKNKSNKRKNSKNKNKKTSYSEKVIKLAKKYRIKLDKNVVKNIKRLLIVQKKAKKYNIRLTKINSTGKRIYKTEKELIKNIKQIIKSKLQKRKTSPKRKTKEQKEKVLREKAKKYNIRLTKTTSTGKRIYKTNKELLRELKQKLKQKL